MFSSSSSSADFPVFERQAQQQESAPTYLNVFCAFVERHGGVVTFPPGSQILCDPLSPQEIAIITAHMKRAGPFSSEHTASCLDRVAPGKYPSYPSLSDVDLSECGTALFGPLRVTCGFTDYTFRGVSLDSVESSGSSAKYYQNAPLWSVLGLVYSQPVKAPAEFRTALTALVAHCHKILPREKAHALTCFRQGAFPHLDNSATFWRAKLQSSLTDLASAHQSYGTLLSQQMPSLKNRLVLKGYLQSLKGCFQPDTSVLHGGFLGNDSGLPLPSFSTHLTILNALCGPENLPLPGAEFEEHYAVQDHTVAGAFQASFYNALHSRLLKGFDALYALVPFSFAPVNMASYYLYEAPGQPTPVRERDGHTEIPIGTTWSEIEPKFTLLCIGMCPKDTRTYFRASGNFNIDYATSKELEFDGLLSSKAASATHLYVDLQFPGIKDLASRAVSINRFFKQMDAYPCAAFAVKCSVFDFSDLMKDADPDHKHILAFAVGGPFDGLFCFIFSREKITHSFGYNLQAISLGLPAAQEQDNSLFF